MILKMIFDFLHDISRVGPLAESLRGSLRGSDSCGKSPTLSVPVTAVSWEPNREPADDPQSPTRGHLVCVRVASAPASALREVTHAAESQVVGKRTERRLFAYDPAGEIHSDGAQIRQLLR